jgi:DNA-binding CsgD family transcriptional regulator
MNDERRSRIIAILGMAMIWPSVYNQLLYPTTFLFNKDGVSSAFMLYIVYALLFTITSVVVIVNRRSFAQKLFSDRRALVLFALMGSAGVALLGFYDPIDGPSLAACAIGIAFTAFYVPIHFIFWGTRLMAGGKNAFVVDAIASYILFCLVVGIRLLLGLHAIWFSICFPLVAAGLALFPAPEIKQLQNQSEISLKSLPKRIMIPSIIFVYLSTAIAIVFNPYEALSNYPPNRSLLYGVLMVLFIIVGIAFARAPKKLEKTSLLIFAFLSIFLVGAILLMGFGVTALFDLSNFPVIAGKISLQFFVWLLILINAKTKHVSFILPATLYLVLIIMIPNLLGVLILYSQGVLVTAAPDSVVLSGITIGSAFLVSATVNFILVFQSVRWQKHQENDLSDLHFNDTSYQSFRETFGLSTRELEIVRLVGARASTKEIADALFVAEATVYSHLKRIYRKADVHSKGELIDLLKEFKAR